MYQYLEEQLNTNFEVIQKYKEDKEDKENKYVCRLRHIQTGRYFVMRKFQGTAEIYRKLLHIRSSYLPEIFDVAEKEGHVIVLEEFVEGDSVYDMLKGAVFSASETRRIALDVCNALSILHGLGIVHRDVKPENIIIRNGNAVLLDFDAARSVKAEGEKDTVVLGTTGYAAPEQYGISQTDGRADIYALGVTMNLMLTGKHPSDQLAKGRMGRIIHRCTDVHPDKRYQSACQLMRVLI